MYSQVDMQPVVRSQAEFDNDHPVYKAWRNQRVCRTFSRDDVRERVVPVYMGLIKQFDDQIGRLLDHLESTGRLADTMIVFTSDHGDNLGVHWLGEKDLFSEPDRKCLD